MPLQSNFRDDFDKFPAFTCRSRTIIGATKRGRVIYNLKLNSWKKRCQRLFESTIASNPYKQVLNLHCVQLLFRISFLSPISPSFSNEIIHGKGNENDSPNVFIFCIFLGYYRVPFLNQFVILAFNDSISSFCSDAVIFHWNNLDLVDVAVHACRTTICMEIVIVSTVIVADFCCSCCCWDYSKCGESESIASFFFVKKPALGEKKPFHKKLKRASKGEREETKIKEENE